MKGRSSRRFGDIVRHGLLALLLLCALGFAATPARACKEDVQHASADLSKLKAKSGKVQAQHRARFAELIKEAQATLNAARQDCNAATGILERAAATAKVATARVPMTAAAALVSQ